MGIVEKISCDLGISAQYLKSFTDFSKLYKIYEIKKKCGTGYRRIHHPAKELKALQYWMIRNVFLKLPTSKHNTAYAKGCSIRNNAQEHVYSRFMLHVDIQNFFNNITNSHLEILLQQHGYSQEDILTICKIVLYKGHLTIGSVVSPIVSNVVMYDFDNSLYESLTCIQDVVYTRYADDIVVSSKEFIVPEILNIIDTHLAEWGFDRNTNKTYYASKSRKRQITGVILDNNNIRIGVGKTRLQQVKKGLYRYLIHEEGNRDEILGQLAFVKSVNDEQYRSLIGKYQNYKNWGSLIGEDDTKVPQAGRSL